MTLKHERAHWLDFALTELIKTRRLQGQRTYACFIDIRKAYDTVWHAGLKAKLLQCGLHGRMYAALCSLYQGGESTIRLGPQLGYSDFFPIETGVRQGCILSPVLYSIFINDLAVTLKQRPECGVPIGPGRLVVLLYADDIVLLSESEEGLAHSWPQWARMHSGGNSKSTTPSAALCASGPPAPSCPPASSASASAPCRGWPCTNISAWSCTPAYPSANSGRACWRRPPAPPTR